jgi:hypothetical protein
MLLIALKPFLVLRRLAQRGLEGRTALIQLPVDLITASQAGSYVGDRHRPEFILGPRARADPWAGVDDRASFVDVTPWQAACGQAERQVQNGDATSGRASWRQLDPPAMVAAARSLSSTRTPA